MRMPCAVNSNAKARELKILLLSVLLLLALRASAQSAPPAALKFMGRDVVVVDSGPDPADEFFPKGPASVCLAGQPRQCYTTPRPAGHPVASVVQVKRGMPALLFSSDSGGVSGTSISFVLLRLGAGGDLDNLFPKIEISEQSQNAFWNEPSISDAQSFITADYVLGVDEAHWDKHRYRISAYVLKPSSLLDGPTYQLEDQFMTARKYDLEGGSSKVDILAAKKLEILRRLRQVKRQQHRR